MPATTIVLAGRYRLDDRIAAGGVGEVWRATDTALARPVAVKLLRAEYAQHHEALARFRAEARHAGSLSHPGIARVYDYGEGGQHYPPYLVMELVEGPSLAELLSRGRLSPAHTMDVVAQIAAGLAAAHAAGLVHRDIKPANLLLCGNGRVKITDFGIAHAAGSAPLTRTGLLIGTPAYLAPERVAGASGTPAADLYALGVVAYECLAGCPPFGGEPVVVAAAHRDRPLPALPPAVPPGIAALIRDLTRKDPRARPGSALAVARRAAALRDAPDSDVPAAGALAEGVVAEGVVAEGVLTGAGPDGDATTADAARREAAAAPEQPATRVAVPPGPGRGRRDWPLRWVAAAVAAAALAAGLAGWLFAGLLQGGRPGPGPPATSHRVSPSARAPAFGGASAGRRGSNTAARSQPGHDGHRAGHGAGHARHRGHGHAGGNRAKG
ncbi:MAG: serine/threonine-protein kinase [Gemmatimonadota bacterium]